MITMKRAQELRISVVDNHIIRDYMMRISRGDLIDPVVVSYRYDNGSFRVIDGNHRAAAYKLLGMDIPTIPA